MPRNVVVESVIFETDVPELVLARDGAGTAYLSLLVDRSATGDNFLCVAASEQRVMDVRRGTLDLRQALLNNETAEVFAASFAALDGIPSLQLSPLSEIPPHWLPAPGLFLSDFLPPLEEENHAVLTEAAVNNVSVCVLSLDPPEASETPKIDAYHLADGVRLFQNFLRHAYTKAIAGASALTRAMLGAEDAYLLEATGFAGGSFQIHFRSKWAADVSGTTGVGLALEKAYEITKLVDDPEESLPVLRRNSGHVIAAYQSLLHFIATENAPLKFIWADPGSHAPRSSRISVDAARRLYDVLMTRQDLSAVEVELVGNFVKLSRDGSWVLRSGGKTLKGVSEEGAGDLLAGLIFETQQYRLTCEERLDEAVGSGRQRTRLVLKLPPMAE